MKQKPLHVIGVLILTALGQLMCSGTQNPSQDHVQERLGSSVCPGPRVSYRR